VALAAEKVVLAADVVDVVVKVLLAVPAATDLDDLILTHNRNPSA